MKFVSKMMMGLGVVNIILSLMQGFLTSDEYQAGFATSAREYFLLSAVIFVVGLRMFQRSKQIEQEFSRR